MRAVVQRVSQSRLSVAGEVISAIGPGLVVLLGVGHGDGPEQADYLARKTANLRIFADAEDKLNLSVLDIGGEVLAVSQFTLYADTRRGNRPGFDQAAAPEVARLLYERYVDALRAAGVRVQTGVFQAHMAVELTNDGPVTIILESPGI